jgi:FkbM family methyltransferase
MHVSIFSTIKFIVNHPLNSGHRVASISRFLKWQIGSRIVPGAVVVPFVNHSRLVVRPGMTGATGNIYTGLHEFEEMALVLHALLPEDTFVDVGANVGSYTVLAGAAVGCSCVSMEPCPATFEDLKMNILINRMSERCRAENVAVGSTRGVLRFTKLLDTTNHVVSSNEILREDEVIEVPVRTLDEILGDTVPTVIKIDVEGYEREVIAGAGQTLANAMLLTVIMEINSRDEILMRTMLGRGFQPFRYLPKQRLLVPWRDVVAGNVIFVRDPELLQKRVKNAPLYDIDPLHINV